jgi:DNA-binding LytR/AlgR family response regulator
MISSLTITVVSSTNTLFTSVSRVISQMVSANISLHQVYSVAEAAYAITANKSPLVMLEHRLSDGTGFDVLKHAQFQQGREFAFMYVGNHNGSGLRAKALAHGALAYLEMPIDNEALQQALQQFLFDYEIFSQVSPRLLAAVLSAPEPPEYTSSARTPTPLAIEPLVFVPSADELISLDIKHEGKRTTILVRIYDILYCHAERNNLAVITVHASEGIRGNAADTANEHTGIYRTTATLKQYYQRLAGYGFVIAERSHLVNLRHIRTIEGKQILLSNNQRLPVGGTYSNTLRERFTQWVRAGGGRNNTTIKGR